MRYATPLAAVAITLVLGACSHSSSPTPPTAAQASATSTPIPASHLPQPDPSIPDQSYVLMETPIQVLALESALSSPKYDLMAKATSNDYRNTQDSFKRHDLLTTLQPKFDAAINEAKTHPYIAWLSPFPQIGHYDFKSQTFPVNAGLFQPEGASQFYVDGQPYARIGVTNGAAFRTLHVTDQATARTMEALVGQNGGMRLKVFGFVQNTDDSGTPTLQTTVVKVQVLDTHDQVLFEQAVGGAP